MATQPNLFRHCPLCGADDASPHLESGQMRLVRCRRCGMIYANPVPAQFATGDHYNQIATEYYLAPAKLESDYADVRFERELRLFRKYARAGAVLDVGCSSGGFLFQLGRRFPGSYQMLGTDVSGPALDYAESRGIPVTRGDFLEQGGKFDAITFWAVLEHVFEPKAFLRKAAALLNPTGLCFVLVPNMKSLAVRLLGPRYRYIYPQHVNYFTAQTLGKLADPQFCVLELCTMHFNPLVILQDWRSSGAEVSNESRAELLQKTTALKRKRLLRPAKALYQLTERLLAKLWLADNLAVVLRKVQH